MKRLLPDTSTSSVLLSSLLVLALTACDGPDPELSAICHSSTQDCACENDSDCTITQYYQDVFSDEDCCYPYVCCAPGRPLRKDAAQRNESNYDQANCADRSDLDCDACESPTYEYWPSCQEGVCASIRLQKI